ncbi:hypothetical protein IKF34_02705 [Candidatus Saccharibacteria bacterium]|nr:hypothetical protein [Candidatus Saccharibacteria bacterium]
MDKTQPIYDNLKSEYEDFATDCSAALRLVEARINNLDQKIERSVGYSPFFSITSRIKTFESVMEKLERKGIDPEIESLKHRIRDVAGIRIVTLFRDEVYEVANLICRIPDFTVVDTKDYYKNPKNNGYASLHIHVQVSIYDPIEERSKLITIEIQIRSISTNMWASIEHRIKYKNPNPSPKVEERFKSAAKALEVFDKTVMKLRDYEESSPES